MQLLNKKELLFCTVLLLLMIVLGVFIRLENRDTLEDPYLIGTDSYRHFRQTRQIVESGNLPHIDTMRNSPEGIDNTTNTTLFPYLLAYAFTVANTFFPNLSLYQFTSFFSIIVISFAALLLYAFTNRLFGKIAALFATLVFVSTPFLTLTSLTGFLDTNAPNILLFLTGIYFYTVARQEQQMWKRNICTILSGITLSFLGLMWKGVGFAIGIVVLFNFIKLCTKGYDKIDFTQFVIWFLPILAGLLGFTKMYRSHLFDPNVILAVGVPIGFGIFAAVFIGIKSLHFPEFRSFSINKVPLGVGMSVLFLFLGGIILTTTSQSLNWILTLINAIFYPFGKNGIMEFVSELQPTTFSMWRQGYGLLLIFAIPGLCLLTYTRPLINRKSFLFHCLLTGIALLGIAVSRFVPLLNLPFSWLTDSLIFAISAILLVSNTLYQYSLTTHIDTTDTVNENKSFLISAWFIASYMLACSAIRFHLFLAPIVAMLSGYMLSKLLKKYMPESNNNWYPLTFLAVLLAWQVLICGKDILTFLTLIVSLSHLSLKLPERLQLIVTLFVTVIFFGFILQSLFYRKQTQYSIKKACTLIIVCLITWVSITGIYRLGPTQTSFIVGIGAQPPLDGRIRDTLKWLKTQTPPEVVIAANWDLGSAINELSKKTTIIDEEQNFAKIRAISQAVFHGKSEDEALNFLKEHRTTHLLLQPEDILQFNYRYFTATQRSDNISEFSPITPLKSSNKSYNNLEYSTNIPLVYKMNTKHYSEQVKKVTIPFSWDIESFEIRDPASVVIRDGNSEKTLSVKELIIADRQWYFPGGKINGIVWKPSGIVRDIPLEFMDPLALYISPEARESLTVKLYLGEHSDNFKLAYESPKTYGPMPIKIWEINYEE